MAQQDRELEDGASASGSVNTVVRQGNTVHRPAGAWTPAVHHLLCYLDTSGFDRSPRVIGMDHAQGNEVLSYVHGEVAKRPWPRCLREDDGLVEVAMLVQAYHRVVKSYVPLESARWRTPDVAWTPDMIVRHGDLGPWNMVWKSGKLVGLIDWDFAEPGYPMDDIAQVAWYCIPLRPEDQCLEAGMDPARQRHRLGLICRIFAVGEVDVVRALARLQQRELQRLHRYGSSGIEPWASFAARGDLDYIAREARWLRTTFPAPL